MRIPEEVKNTIKDKLKDGLKNLERSLSVSEENLDVLGYVPEIDIDVMISVLREMRPNAVFLQEVKREENQTLEEVDLEDEL